MRNSARAMIAALLAIVSLSAQSNARLKRAIDLVERNDVDALRRLLKEDPSLVRATDAGVLPHWQWTLLHKATADPSVLDIVAALIDAGAAINARDNEGNTPLHFAMKRIGREKLPARDYDGIIRLLLENKADVHALNISGATPLHTAAAFRADPSGVEMLVQAGADVNLKVLASYGGWTPLHGAAARNSAGIVAVLLKHGADPAATDAKGLTPLQVAQQNGFADAATTLRASAAAPSVGFPAPRSASTGGVVQGRVLWNGQPVAGATVYVADPPPGSARYGTVTTDAQGRFVITGVPEGARFVSVRGDPQIFPVPNGANFTMTTSPFVRDFLLCKGFTPVAPAHNESVSGRPMLRWDPFPDAARYLVIVVSQVKAVFSRGGQAGGLTDTSVQVDVDLPPGVYQWRVYAYTAGGQNIGCSFEPRAFIVRPW